MSLDLAQALTAIEEIIDQIAQPLRDGFNQPHEEATKSSNVDIVTETDKAIEAIILDEIKQRFPAHNIVGEETGEHIDGAADYYWYIDPIDGTTNFASGIPHFSTSIALTDGDVNPLVGVVFLPMTNDLYTAIRGGGAYLNGERLQVSTASTLIQSVLGSGFGYDKHTNPDNNLAQWAAFTTRVRGVRRIGSAAMDLAYVAAGCFEGFWEPSLNRWDVMAGLLLIEEAGGVCTDYRGQAKPQLAIPGSYVVSNGHIHQAMLDVIAESYGWTSDAQ